VLNRARKQVSFKCLENVAAVSNKIRKMCGKRVPDDSLQTVKSLAPWEALDLRCRPPMLSLTIALSEFFQIGEYLAKLVVTSKSVVVSCTLGNWPTHS